MKLFSISLLALMAFIGTLGAQMTLTATPDPLSFNASAGAYDSRILSVTNTGGTTQYYSLLTQPPSLTNNLVSYYPFDNDRSDLMNNWTGAVTGTYFASDPQNHPQSAIGFNGISEYYETWESGLANTFSVSFRAKTLRNQPMTGEGFYIYGITADYLLTADWYAASNMAGLGIALGMNGFMVIEHAASYMPVLLSYNADLSGWNHYTVVFSGHTPKLYVNGTLVRTGITSPRQFTYLSSLLGGTGYGFFEGLVDDYCVYNAALSDAQIQDSYQFTDRARFWIQPRKGSLAPGQTTTLPVRLIDPTLAAGSYSDQISLCQMGSLPLTAPVPIVVSNSAGQAVPPENITVTFDGFGNALLNWSAVSPTPTCYNVYTGAEPFHPERYTYLGNTNSTSFICIGGGEPFSFNQRFFSVVAYIE